MAMRHHDLRWSVAGQCDAVIHKMVWDAVGDRYLTLFWVKGDILHQGSDVALLLGGLTVGEDSIKLSTEL